MNTHQDKFKFLDHPSDLKAEIYGKDYAELFVNAALAMMNYLYPKYVDVKNDHEVQDEIKVRAWDIKELIIDWLEELLDLTENKSCCYNEFTIKKINEEELVATAYGRRVRTKNDIQRVTSRNLEIKKEKDKYIAHIIFDI